MRYLINRFRSLRKEDVSDLLVVWAIASVTISLCWLVLGFLGIPVGVAVALAIIVAFGVL
jgi:small basic protein